MRRQTLTLFKEYFDDILSGNKRIEYRVNKPYWFNRCFQSEPLGEIEFINGYGKHRPRMIVTVKEVTCDPITIFIHLDQIMSVANLTEDQQKILDTNKTNVYGKDQESGLLQSRERDGREFAS